MLPVCSLTRVVSIAYAATGTAIDNSDDAQTDGGLLALLAPAAALQERLWSFILLHKYVHTNKHTETQTCLSLSRLVIGLCTSGFTHVYLSINRYFGPEIALCVSFLAFVTAWLTPPATLGLCVFLYQVYSSLV